MAKINGMEGAIKCMVKEIKGLKSTKSKELVESYSGKKTNVNRIPAKDVYQYGLRLLDVLFSKEMMGFLLVTSKRSQKPALDKK